MSVNMVKLSVKYEILSNRLIQLRQKKILYNNIILLWLTNIRIKHIEKQLVKMYRSIPFNTTKGGNYEPAHKDLTEQISRL